MRFGWKLGSPGLRTKHNRSTAGTPRPQSRPERATPIPTTSLLAARGERGAPGLLDRWQSPTPASVAAPRPAPRIWCPPPGTQQDSTHRRPRRQSSREVCSGRARGPGGLRGGRASRGRRCFGAWLGGKGQMGRGLGGEERQPRGRRSGDEATT